MFEDFTKALYAFMIAFFMFASFGVGYCYRNVVENENVMYILHDSTTGVVFLKGHGVIVGITVECDSIEEEMHGEYPRVLSNEYNIIRLCPSCVDEGCYVYMIFEDGDEIVFKW